MFQNADEEVAMKYQGTPTMDAGTGAGTVLETNFTVPTGKRWIVSCASYQIVTAAATTAHVHMSDGSTEVQLDFPTERDVADANLCFGGQMMLDEGWVFQIHTTAAASQTHNHQIHYMEFDK